MHRLIVFIEVNLVYIFNITIFKVLNLFQGVFLTIFFIFQTTFFLVLKQYIFFYKTRKLTNNFFIVFRLLHLNFRFIARIQKVKNCISLKLFLNLYHFLIESVKSDFKHTLQYIKTLLSFNICTQILLFPFVRTKILALLVFLSKIKFI